MKRFIMTERNGIYIIDLQQSLAYIDRDERCHEVYNIQVQGLTQRLRASGIGKLVIGISGGLDSTHALLVCARAMVRDLYQPSEGMRIMSLGMSGLGNSSAQAALMPAIRKGKAPILGTYTSTKAGLDPVNPMFYAGFCGFKEMAQVGTGFFAEHFKVKAPTMAVVHLDVASGKEYFDHVAEALA